ncbi:MAG: 50S ribosomal protein L32 [Planctomycetota bacterium]|jgi:large subunit ribosomal protein L32|nr:50S ribosomal protein L32 [Planctomycetota bacterium]
MAVPKRRTSKARKRKRRSHDALPQQVLVHCGKCEKMIPPHTICNSCGFYSGRIRSVVF